MKSNRVFIYSAIAIVIVVILFLGFLVWVAQAADVQGAAAWLVAGA